MKRTGGKDGSWVRMRPEGFLLLFAEEPKNFIRRSSSSGSAFRK
jgi:hypothetical protein